MILALRALGLGDLLAAVPALRALRRTHPHEELVLATPAPLGDLARWATAVDAILPTAGLVALGGGARGADVAVNLHGRGPTSTELLAATAPTRLVAFGEPDCPAWDDEEHERARWCRLLADSGLAVDADPDDLLVDPPALPAQTIGRLVGATVIHPGASSGARRWPVSRWVDVARSEAATGRPVIVTGSAGEAALAHSVARGAGLGADAVLAGATTALDLLAVVAAADRVVCGDTGVAHVASAVGTPSVVLFGPVPPSRWGPPSWGPHIALWKGTTGDPHADAPAEGLLAITPDDVREALARLPPAHAVVQA